MAMYLEVTTPQGGQNREMESERAHEDSIQVADSPNKLESASRFDVRISSSFDRDKKTETGRSVAQVYVPTLQERVHVALLGPCGLALELTNFILSMVIFFAYIAELYDKDIYYSDSRTAVEMVATTFFIFDFGLHIFVASDPWKYVFSALGMIDLVTIVPSLIVFIDPGRRSNLMFVFRVLRIFRILRVLRLAHYIQFKKHGFEYELGVFILSTIAVILCAAGIFQALESDEYDEDRKLQFHDSLYFVLVTVSTIGYGDISPHTVLGHVFVIVVIIGIFTIVPAEVNKLNELAKQNKPWDKEVAVKSSGHIVVSGYNLSATTVLEFLQEFYHPSRGSIHLDVVFISDEPPSLELICILEKQKYRRRTSYLRGSLMKERDQCRVKMASATAVFFLANNRHEPAQQDAATILHAVSIRNYTDSCEKQVDIYVQLLSRVREYEMSAMLLGANATKTSALKDMLLARAIICPGSSTLILNLIRSYHLGQYAKRRKWCKAWIHEYLDGLTYEIFPITFSSRFEHCKFEIVARHIYEKYGALLFSTSNKDSQGAVHLAPFSSFIQEGDIGFVIARTASDVIHIVNTYGYWEESSERERRVSPSLVTSPVRVSSDSLWRRSPRHRFHPTTRSASIANIRLDLADSIEDCRWRGSPANVECTNDEVQVKTCNVPTATLPADPPAKPKPTPIAVSRVRSMNAAISSPSNGSALSAAIQSKDMVKIEAVFERDHYRANVKGESGHYVICSRNLSDAVSIARLLRRYTQQERNHCALDGANHTEEVRIVFLIVYKPTAKDLMIVANESSANLLRDVLLVVGSPARTNDLVRVEASKARQIVILPLDKSVSREADQLASTYEVSEFGLNGQINWTDDERLADFGVVCSLLAVEITKQGFSSRISPRNLRRQSSRFEMDSRPSPTAQNVFKRELEQGIPLESVKLRALGRFPGHHDPSIFSENADINATQQGASQLMRVFERKITNSDSRPASTNTLSVLHYACNAKLCRPCDEAVQDEFPSLTPSFAGGSIFLSSLLNRIVCQAFYNPYIMEVIEALANGSGSLGLNKNDAAQASRATSFGGANENFHRRLYDVEIDEEFVGGVFIDVFLDYISKEMLVIGVMRHTCPELDNLLPFVYTCPPPSLIMHSNDRLFVLG